MFTNSLVKKCKDLADKRLISPKNTPYGEMKQTQSGRNRGNGAGTVETIIISGSRDFNQEPGVGGLLKDALRR